MCPCLCVFRDIARVRAHLFVSHTNSPPPFLLQGNKSIDLFDVIRCLAVVPKTEVRNMASKLCIQLHSFPRDLFKKIKETEIVDGQDNEILNAMKVELRHLVSFKRNFVL
jgi:hypothetical protein